MNLHEIRRLVGQGEGQHIEFKRKSADPLKIVRELVAFANHSGGVLLVGVNDDGNIPGLKYPQEEAFIIEKHILAHCHPLFEYQIHYVDLNSQKQIVAFQVKESAKKPVYLLYNLKKKVGRAYIRVADRSVKASREVRKVLKARSNPNDIGFQYGKNEQFIMQYLAENPRITLPEFIKLAAIPPEEASQTLINLTISNVLELHPADGYDWFTLKEQTLF